MGGGFMRTAAKAAKAASLAAHGPWIDPAMAAGRFSRPPATVPVAGQIAEGFVSSSSGSENAATVEKKGSWTADEWEFAGGAEEVSESLRIVFGPVPTLEEAREASEHLKSALEDSSGDLDAGKELAGILPSYPTHIVQAFSFLRESSQAQEVVASLACDKNIWDAVMKNEMAMQFYKTHQINPSLEEPKKEVTIESFESIESDQNPKESDPVIETRETPLDSFNNFVDFIKVKLEETGNKLSEFVKDLMGGARPAAPPSADTATAKKTASPGGGSACYENIWDAVMKNEMAMQFYKTRRINPSLEEVKNEFIKSNQNPKESNPISESRETPLDGLNNFVDFIKVKLEETGNKLSGFMKDLMGGVRPTSPPIVDTATPTPIGGSAAVAVDLSLTAPFIVLAIATILIILFKRG